MIKRFCFGITAPPPSPAELHPLRTTVSMAVKAGEERQAFVTQWFADEQCLADYEAWEATQGPAGVVVLAEEIVHRGADWLEQRWANGGLKYKHVALAERAAGVSPLQMSVQWLQKAGRSPTRDAGMVAIPAEARGLAYVQNHPLSRTEGRWLFDAITEVWFDDLNSMQARISWFRERIAMDALFAHAKFLPMTETLWKSYASGTGISASRPAS